MKSLSFVIQDLTYIALNGRLRHEDNEILRRGYSKVLNTPVNTECTGLGKRHQILMFC